MTDAVILFVDDEAGFVDAMCRRLSRRNMFVHKAFEGEGALNLLAEHNGIDVVVLDMKMPGRDGMSVLEDIRQGYPQVEVIMLTGHGTVESAIEGMHKGAYDYLLKPCDIEVLVDRIHQAAAHKREREAQATKNRVDHIAGSIV
ncbi:response regulator [Pseudodesulfovibrio senegalensis]|uniref:Response regulator n=1 Tax=Pseudodesulfovibrio senegalensis TaxID=1721087 RepID=A0A6N6N441_9BACT|nr:response regulator [Pseudodesulfovibrio senegalensis]KAB1442846.1 response regulator [Pseudodesulfovibrio senegalensis]